MYMYSAHYSVKYRKPLVYILSNCDDVQMSGRTEEKNI